MTLPRFSFDRLTTFAFVATWLVIASASPAFSQMDEVRSALAQDNHLEVLRILSRTPEETSTPDTYLYRSIAYANLQEYERALDAFREGFNRYPGDPRFQSEGMAFAGRTREILEARFELRKALIAAPDNVYASALRASLDRSGGTTGSELAVLNQRGVPAVARILDNYSPVFSKAVTANALAFRSGAVLTLNDWKTTAARLNATRAFSSVALELESSLEAGKYNAIVRTTRKSNRPAGFLLGILKGLPVKTSYLDVWNIGDSFVQWTSKYRWESTRRRAEGQVLIPLPVPGLLFMELGSHWRSEEWDVPAQERFKYKSSGVRLNFKHIPDHRVELAAGVEYLKRSGADTGRLLLSARFRPLDGIYKSQVRFDSFLARAAMLGDVDYTGGTIQTANRLVISETQNAFIDLSLKGGAARGRLPVEDYFMLGIDSETVDPLRAHLAADHGRYGRGPMGTDFVLINSDLEKRVAVLPILGSVPVHGEVFFDAAKVFDRYRRFPQRGWLLDTGIAARILLSDSDVVVLYGRNLRESRNVFTAYIERRFW
jgi:tetratricopeptide (TPR) repeat protein